MDPKENRKWIPRLKALADERRLALIACLLESPMDVATLAERTGTTIYNTSKHLRILREAGIIESEKRGRHLISSIAAELPASGGENDGDSRTLDLGCCVFRFPTPWKADANGGSPDRARHNAC